MAVTHALVSNSAVTDVVAVATAATIIAVLTATALSDRFQLYCNGSEWIHLECVSHCSRNLKGKMKWLFVASTSETAEMYEQALKKYEAAENTPKP